MTWLSIIAVIIAPVIAVWVGQFLQERSEKRKDKMEVFKAIMTDRYGWSRETVLALNSIPIVFADDNSVRECWKEYYKCLCIQQPDEAQQKQQIQSFYKLVESMAIALNYKHKINWEDIQNPYVPKGMANYFDNNIVIQNMMASLLQNMVLMQSSSAQTQCKNENHDSCQP